MTAIREVPIRLAGRRAVGDTVIGVIRAAMDEELGTPLAQLHLARAGQSGRRQEVREGEMVIVGDIVLRVRSIRPYTGQGPAGVVLTIVTGGSGLSAELG